MCIALTKDGSLCRMAGKATYCHFHQKTELIEKNTAQHDNLAGLNRRVCKLTDKMAELVLENSRLAEEAEDANFKLEVMRNDNKLLRESLHEYNFIRHFAQVYAKVKRITGEKKFYDIKPHLYLYYPHTREAIKQMFQMDNGEEIFNLFNSMREKRNKYAHATL